MGRVWFPPRARARLRCSIAAVRCRRRRTSARAAFATTAALAGVMLPAAGPVFPAHALGDTPVWTADGGQASAHLGYAVAPAGDVNGDGYGDIVAGARSWNGGQTNEGRALLWLGGPGGPVSPPAWTAQVDQVLAFSGSSVASAGDVNGDGFADVLVGTQSWDGALSNEGRVDLYLGGPGGLSTAPAWTREGGQVSATFGASVAFAGDVNADGYDDFLVGARGFDGAQADGGRAFLFLGDPVLPDTAAAWTADGTQEDSGFGYSVATAGDVNGDGFADVIVGAFWQDGVQIEEGAAFVFLGSGSGLSAVPDWSVIGGQSRASLGWSVGTAGDVNADGYADVIVGVRHWDGAAGLDTGRALVFHGGPSGPGISPDWSAEGGEEGALLGWSVGTAGDTNGDGYADVIVGAYREDVTWLDDGAARVWLGGPDGLADAPVWTATSAQAGAAFGWSVAGAGDTDGDGLSDVIVGAYLHDQGAIDEGRVSVYLGCGTVGSGDPSWTATAGPNGIVFGETVAYAGDVDGDGTSDVLVGDPLANFGVGGEGRVDLFRGAEGGPDGSPDWSTVGPHADAGWGRAIASACDVNGDGYDDVVIGAPLADGAFSQEGQASLFLGGPLGLGASAAWAAFGGQAAAAFGACVAGLGDANGDGFADLAVGAPEASGAVPLSGAVDFFRGRATGPSSSANLRLQGTQTGAAFGASIAAAGDVNGDGLADLLVGEPSASAGEPGEGRAHLYLGTPSGLETFAAWTAQGGQEDARFGEHVAGAGDVDGDGHADVLITAPLFDAGEIDEGRVFLFRGTPEGLEVTAAWTWEPDLPGARVDRAASAGDVNGDGHDDVAIGISRWHGDSLLEGRVVVFAGSDSGLGAVPVLELAGTVSGGRLGTSLDGRGDADGDGRPDLLVGSRGYAQGGTSGGAAFLFPAGGAPGPATLVRQRRVDDIAPVTLGARTDGDAFRIVVLARSAAGRVPVSIAWDLAAGDGAWLPAGSTIWTDPGAPAPGAGSRVEIAVPVPALAAGESYRWRVRTRSRSPWFADGPWRYPGASSGSARHLFTPGPVAAPPPSAPLAPAFGLAAAPLPFRDRVELSFTLPAPGRVRLDIHDVAGRRVVRLIDAPAVAGFHGISWDGRDGTGRAVAPGVYWARLEIGGRVSSRRVVRVR